jgi:hypothetical protein
LAGSACYPKHRKLTRLSEIGTVVPLFAMYFCRVLDYGFDDVSIDQPNSKIIMNQFDPTLRVELRTTPRLPLLTDLGSEEE